MRAAWFNDFAHEPPRVRIDKSVDRLTLCLGVFLPTDIRDFPFDRF
jgi:hypothetical protein